MKRKMLVLGMLLLLGLFLIFPDPVSQGAKSGLTLWFSVVFPALLPFMVISGTIVRMGIASSIGRILYPLLHKCLHVSENGCYPVVIGLLSGYPLGAKTVADLCISGGITQEEGQYLLTFCNNASPMFMLEYMGAYCMGLPRPELLLLIVYLSAFLNAFLHQKRLGCYQKDNCVVKYTRQEKKEDFFMNALDESILDSFVTLAKVGGYIILFSILAGLGGEMLPLSPLTKTAGLGIIELTTGGEYIRNLLNNSLQIWILGAAVCAFGGLSSIAQTSSVLQGSGLSLKKYFLAKLCQTLIAAGLATVLGIFVL